MAELPVVQVSHPEALPLGADDSVFLPTDGDMPPFEAVPLDPSLTAAQSDGGTIDLEPNVIQGTVRLTNQTPEILELLATDPWHSSGSVSASSTKPSGFSALTTAVQFTSPSEFKFKLFVEASAGGDGGVVYNLTAGRGVHYYPNGDSFFFLPVLPGVVVKPRELQPGPTEVTLDSCIGAVHFDFGTDETCSTQSPAFLSASVTNVYTYRHPGKNRHTLYLTGGAALKQTLSYTFKGKDGRSYTLSKPLDMSAGCDEVVRVCTTIPDNFAVAQGNLTGPWEIVGETSTHTRNLYAGHLSVPGLGRGITSSSPAAPESDPRTWWTLSQLQEGDWYLYGVGYLRKGREFTYFQTQLLHPATSAGPVTVIPNQTMPVTKVVDGQTRHAFVMRPAWFYGAVRLADPFIPLHPGSRSTLESLYFEADYDTNGDGVPNDPTLGNRGAMLYARAPVVHGSYSRTAFRNSFDRSTGELASTYELALPSPYDLPLNWNQEYLSLGFWSEGATTTTRPGLHDEARFRYGRLNLYQEKRSALLNPEQRMRVDHEYCFNEVQVHYATDLGLLYNPFAEVSGSYKGKDWRGQTVSYSAYGTFYGTPALWGYPLAPTDARQTGSVSLTLPQGTFSLKPGAALLSADGTVNTANFAPLSVTLGCGQRLKLVPPLAVSISSASGCTTGPSVPISGVVKSKPAVVDRIWYRLNGGPEVTLCTNCGIDPTYAFTLPLKACHNSLEVFAYTEGMPEPATGVAEYVWDDPADGPSCADSYCVNRPPVARCRSVTVAADSACSGCASVDDGSYDPDEGDTFHCVQTPECPFAPGSRKVTRTCTDAAGLSSSCEATITVKDTTAPVLVCPEQAPVLECRDAGAVATFAATASDNCGSATTTCSPASGSTFPLGTTHATCTSTDNAGNRASCSVPVTVRDTQLPLLTCPAPLTAECSGGAASVTPPAATASDTCQLAEVVNPAAASFPLGTTVLTYSAKDTFGNQATCTSSIEVADTRPPLLVLNGRDTVTLACGVGTPYIEQGATASDVCQGDLSSQVLISGTVDPSTPGSYTVTYTVADASGNTAAATRTVHVEGAPSTCSVSSAQWLTTGGLASPRLLHTATPLPSGKVLVTGGFTWSTELYDPATGAWQRAGNAFATHRDHTATLLPDGRVLVAGGDGSEPGTFCEVYDAATGLWLPTGHLATARRHHTATLLPSGKVLVTGGSDDTGAVQS
ncbi:HYR domain-containing protein, partial [Archangium sp.]|uniref:HYR domain-containing protein n=1 Tax=Archangium sp. TaxID=1872627 RepID=UPI002D2A3092